jgi:hypothetical protein
MDTLAKIKQLQAEILQLKLQSPYHPSITKKLLELDKLLLQHAG